MERQLQNICCGGELKGLVVSGGALVFTGNLSFPVSHSEYSPNWFSRSLYDSILQKIL